MVGPFSPEQMLGIGQVLADSILARIRHGVTVDDAPARPLKPGKPGRRGYPDYKIARGLQPIRDWTWRGRTLRSLKVKSVNENRAVIGFVDPQSDAIAHINNLRERQFGVSPADSRAVIAAVRETSRQHRVVRTIQVA